MLSQLSSKKGGGRGNWILFLVIVPLFWAIHLVMCLNHPSNKSTRLTRVFGTCQPPRYGNTANILVKHNSLLPSPRILLYLVCQKILSVICLTVVYMLGDDH